MDAVSATGSIQVAVQAVKQAVDQERNIASLVQASASPAPSSSALDITPPAAETGRGQIVDILA